MISKETIVRILVENEIGSIENDGTRSVAGFVRRDEYHNVADKILSHMSVENPKGIPKFWLMRDNHTFVELHGTNIYEVMSDAKKVSKLNPYASIGPVKILNGDKESQIGIMANVDGNGNVDLDAWYNAIKDNEVIKSFGNKQ